VVVASQSINPAHASSQHYEGEYQGSQIPICGDSNPVAGAGLCTEFTPGPTTMTIVAHDEVVAGDVCGAYGFDTRPDSQQPPPPGEYFCGPTTVDVPSWANYVVIHVYHVVSKGGQQGLPVPDGIPVSSVKGRISLDLYD
jgi:hypothetical protein